MFDKLEVEHLNSRILRDAFENKNNMLLRNPP